MARLPRPRWPTPHWEWPHRHHPQVRHWERRRRFKAIMRQPRVSWPLAIPMQQVPAAWTTVSEQLEKATRVELHSEKLWVGCIHRFKEITKIQNHREKSDVNMYLVLSKSALREVKPLIY